MGVPAEEAFMWRREALRWKRTAWYFMAVSCVNFLLAWGIALCRLFGGAR